MPIYKEVKKWVAPHTRTINGKRVRVRGYYNKVKILIPGHKPQMGRISRPKISDKFKAFVNKYVEDSAEDHCQIHKNRYFGKNKRQLEEDLYINWDDSGEIQFVKDTYKGATKEEIEYYLDKFKKECLKYLGHGCK